MTAIGHTVDQIMQGNENPEIKKIERRDYDQWARGFVFEAMRNQRYGQSFCNHFGIQDNILYYSASVADADQYIQKLYVR